MKMQCVFRGTFTSCNLRVTNSTRKVVDFTACSAFYFLWGRLGDFQASSEFPSPVQTSGLSATSVCTAPHPTAVFTLLFPSLQPQHFQAHVFKLSWIYYVLPETPRLLLHFLANIPSSTWLLKPENWGGPSLFPLPQSPSSSGPPILSSEFVFTVASPFHPHRPGGSLWIRIVSSWIVSCLASLSNHPPSCPNLMSVWST